jgi:hypothetical protein
MYLRFVVTEIDEDSQKELGVFHAVAYLREDGKLFDYEEKLYDEIRLWFNKHLERPARFTASKGKHHLKLNKAISWFKSGAHEHLERVRGLVSILQNHGIHVHTLKTKKVGYVVYEDDFQIVAEPFKQT